MKKLMLSIAIAAWAFSASAMAEFDTSKLSMGAGYGLANNGVLSFRADYDIREQVDKPIKLRFGYDRYTREFGGVLSDYSWSYNVFYGGAYYDFNEALNLGENIHPFAGLGFGFGSVSCSGRFCGSSPTVGGFYYITGVQYDINKQFSAELSFTAWGGLTVGANYRFK